MRLKSEITMKQITLVELMKCHKLEEVSGYCASCSNYKRNHSCPEFNFDIVGYLGKYNYATVIMTGIDTREIKKHQSELMMNEYKSRVFTNYKINNPDVKADWNAMLSMYVFDHVKTKVEEKLLKAESLMPSSVSLPPGSCTRCSKCSRQDDTECVLPEKLRYSLEALGFLVSDIYKDHFDIELEWTKDELPASFITCSALLTVHEIDIDKVREELGIIEVVL